ncbi:hypothetical protein [Aliidiomarina soli]|nr:hypothetical protein [Aliidiomarina soli]
MSSKIERIVKLMDAQREEGKVSFYPSLLCQLSLPMARTSAQLFLRDSGKVKLKLTSSAELPYGSIPRRILYLMANHIDGRGIVSWPGSQAKLLKSMSLGTSGADVTRLKAQISALTRLRITLLRDDKEIFRNEALLDVVNGQRFPQFSDAAKLYIMQSLTPVDNRTAIALIQTPFAFDLYVWLTWRSVSLKKPVTRISWRQLHQQFASCQGLSAFKQHFRRQLSLVALAYPSIIGKVNCETDFLQLRRYSPHVKARVSSKDNLSI